MNPALVQRILGLVLMSLAATLVAPLVVSLLYDDDNTGPFLIGLGVAASTGFAFWLPVRNVRRELRLRDGFLLVVLLWIVVVLAGAVPFFGLPGLGFTDAVFESTSGFTTSSATILTGI